MLTIKGLCPLIPICDKILGWVQVLTFNCQVTNLSKLPNSPQSSSPVIYFQCLNDIEAIIDVVQNGISLGQCINHIVRSRILQLSAS